MTRGRLVWGGAGAAIVALGVMSVAVALTTTAGPEHHVLRYLDALARDDLPTAARLAGLTGPTEGERLPVGDEGEGSIRRIVGTEPRADGRVAVTAEYGDVRDAALTTFLLEPAPPSAGVIPAWRFAVPPVTQLVVGVDQHDALVVGPLAIRTAGAGEVARVSVLIPARVTVRVAEPLLDATAVTVRATGQAGAVGTEARPLLLRAEPSAALEREVGRALDRLLLGCADQPVLKPAACPFGIAIADRVTAPPSWTIEQRGPVRLVPDDRPGQWRLRAEGIATAALTVQRLLDGRVDPRSESVAFTATGIVRVTRGEALLQLDPAAP